MKVERGPVVDQPRPTVPDEQVRVARRTVDVRDERVEPHDPGGEIGIALPPVCKDTVPNGAEVSAVWSK